MRKNRLVKTVRRRPAPSPSFNVPVHHSFFSFSSFFSYGFCFFASLSLSRMVPYSHLVLRFSRVGIFEKCSLIWGNKYQEKIFLFSREVSGPTYLLGMRHESHPLLWGSGRETRRKRWGQWKWAIKMSLSEAFVRVDPRKVGLKVGALV